MIRVTGYEVNYYAEDGRVRSSRAVVGFSETTGEPFVLSHDRLITPPAEPGLSWGVEPVEHGSPVVAAFPAEPGRWSVKVVVDVPGDDTDELSGSVIGFVAHADGVVNPVMVVPGQGPTTPGQVRGCEGWEMVEGDGS